MTCDEVREVLPEHLLGTLDGPEDLEVRRHLRGCTFPSGSRVFSLSGPLLRWGNVWENDPFVLTSQKEVPDAVAVAVP